MVSCHYLPSDWLERPSEEVLPWRGDHLHKAQAKESLYDCVGLLYSFVVLLHDICVLPRPGPM